MQRVVEDMEFFPFRKDHHFTIEVNAMEKTISLKTPEHYVFWLVTMMQKIISGISLNGHVFSINIDSELK